MLFHETMWKYTTGLLPLQSRGMRIAGERARKFERGRMRRTAVGFILLASAMAVAEERVDFQVNTFPLGAAIYMQDSHGYRAVGTGNQRFSLPAPLLLDRDGRPVVDNLGRPQFGRAKLRLESDQHLPLDFEVGPEELAKGLYKNGAMMALPPDGKWVEAKDFASRYPVVFSLPLLAALALWAIRRKSSSGLDFVGFDTENMDLIGQRIGEYTLEQMIGRGGMGVVYRASSHGQQVAIKILPPHLEEDRFRKRFLRECKVNMELKHPNIIRLIDYGEKRGCLYFVMEYLVGQTLQVHLDNGVSAVEGWKLLEPVFDAIAFAHESNIVHRDLKPDNIFVCQDGRVVVLDFGLARRNDMTMLTTDTVFGSPHFMAPETLGGRGGDVTGAVDQYSLGVLVYRLLSGQFPFDCDIPAALVLMHLQQQAPTLSSVVEGIPSALSDTVAKMLDKSPINRFPSLLEAKKALREGIDLWSQSSGGTVVLNSSAGADETVAVSALNPRN